MLFVKKKNSGWFYVEIQIKTKIENMAFAKLLLTTNWSEREQAEKMAMPIPEAAQVKTDLYFYMRDIKRAYQDDEGHMIIVMNDDATLELEYNETLWKKLGKFIEDNDQ